MASKRRDMLQPILDPDSDGAQVDEFITRFKCPKCGAVSYSEDLLMTEDDLRMAHEIMGCEKDES